jgi:hypothetical protein
MFTVNDSFVRRDDDMCYFDGTRFRALMLNKTGFSIISLIESAQHNGFDLDKLIDSEFTSEQKIIISSFIDKCIAEGIIKLA